MGSGSCLGLLEATAMQTAMLTGRWVSAASRHCSHFERKDSCSPKELALGNERAAGGYRQLGDVKGMQKK